MHYIEGIEQQLIILQEALDDFETNPSKDPEKILFACAYCYQLKSSCSCPEKAYWPVQAVINKLKWLLYRRT